MASAIRTKTLHKVQNLYRRMLSQLYCDRTCRHKLCIIKGHAVCYGS